MLAPGFMTLATWSLKDLMLIYIARHCRQSYLKPPWQPPERSRQRALAFISIYIQIHICITYLFNIYSKTYLIIFDSFPKTPKPQNYEKKKLIKKTKFAF